MRGDVEDFLRRGRTIEPVTDVVRARALTRARAAIIAGPPLPAAESAFGHPRRLRIAIAVAVAFVAGAATAVASLVTRQWDAALDRHADQPLTVTGPMPASPAPPPRADSAPRALRAPRTAVPHAVEIELVQRAQAAFAAGSDRLTLALVAEHDRRFPRGLMAEECAALRIRSLARSGQREEARRAAAEFAARFPRSVLLPAVRLVTK